MLPTEICENVVGHSTASFVTHSRKLRLFHDLVRNLQKFAENTVFSFVFAKCNNDLLTGLLGPYQEIRGPIFFVRPELARAVRNSEGFVFLVRTE